MLAPTTCTNTTYAFQRTIVTNVTNSRPNSVYMDLWLDVNTIGSVLSGSTKFKYVLTTQANDCEHNILSSGNFSGLDSGDKVYLLRNDEYQQTGTNTYYLYVWLDASETDNATQNQPFDISIGGQCMDEAPPLLYGDANLDGIVNSSDHVAVMKHLNGPAFKNADVNCSGTVTNDDYMLIMQYLARSVSFPTQNCQ